MLLLADYDQLVEFYHGSNTFARILLTSCFLAVALFFSLKGVNAADPARLLAILTRNSLLKIRSQKVIFVNFGNCCVSERA